MRYTQVTEIEFSVVGNGIEEHFDTYEQAETFCKELGNNGEQMEVQFFSKEWQDGNEGEVIIFKNFGEEL